MRVSDVVKNINVKEFNLMSRTNETRHKNQHETYKCKCRLDAGVSSSKQRWNEDKCRCECQELIDKGVCDEGLVQNPSNCERECDKSCDAGNIQTMKIVSAEKGKQINQLRMYWRM